MKKSILPLIISLSLTLINALSTWADGVAESGLPFLKLAPGARAVGMGKTFVAQADDATATWWNPAAMAFSERIERSLMRYNLLPEFHISDLYYLFNSAIVPIPKWQSALDANIIYANYGATEGRDENNMPTGTFHSYDMAFTLAYAARLNRILGVGLAGKFIYSHLAEQGAGTERGTGIGTSAAADLGFLCREIFAKDAWIMSPSLALTLTNMGPEISYIDRNQADPLPMTIRLGASLRASQDLNEHAQMGITINGDLDKELVDRYDNGQARPFYEALFSAWTNNTRRNERQGVIRHIGGELWGAYELKSVLFSGAFRTGHYLDIISNRKPMMYGFSAGVAGNQPDAVFDFRFDYAWVTSQADSPLGGTKMWTFSVSGIPALFMAPMRSQDLGFPTYPRITGPRTGRYSEGSFSITSGISVPTGEGSDYYKLGFSIGANAFSVVTDYAQLGLRLAYNRLPLDWEKIMKGFPDVPYSASGSDKILEIVPSCRFIMPAKEEQVFSAFGQLGFGLFVINTNAKLHSLPLDIIPSNAILTKSGLSVGGGFIVGTRNGPKVELLPLYHVIFSEGETSEYFTLGLGIGL